MARPRKFTQTDEGIFVPYQNNDQLVVPIYKADAAIPETERQKSLRAYATFHHRTPSGHRDPISVAFVVDALQRWNPAYYIRAKYMSNMLNQRQTAIRYEPMTTGKILAEICELGEEAYGEREDLYPLQSGVDYKGHVWFVNSLPSTYRWLWKMREQIGESVAALMQKEAEGISPPRLDSAWDRLDTEAVW